MNSKQQQQQQQQSTTPKRHRTCVRATNRKATQSQHAKRHDKRIHHIQNITMATIRTSGLPLAVLNSDATIKYEKS